MRFAPPPSGKRGEMRGWWAAVAGVMLCTSLTQGGASAWAAEPSPAAPALACGGHSSAIGRGAQKSDASRALRAVEAQYTKDLRELDGARGLTAEAAEVRLEAAQRSYSASRRQVLEPLAAGGNAEAMFMLAQDIRDASAPQDVRRWLDLVQCASALDHPVADDELVRWYWHQRDDGSSEAVQRNRARALALAAKAADDGAMWSLRRIATYIAGNVHQYPADLSLARRLLELCAQTDDPACQEALAGLGPYDYGLSHLEKHLWLDRLATRQPARFVSRREQVWTTLGPAEQAIARREAGIWRPTPWPALKSRWRAIEQAILDHGQTSIGADTPCTTATPWCRGDLATRAAR